MFETVVQTLKAHRLIPAGSALVVGVSGGADSLALLHVLQHLAPQFDFRLHAASLDHGLRGEQGAADVAFVRRTAAAWGVPVTTGSVNVPALAAESGLGIEAAARQARYRFLAEVARSVGADRVAVAHHADDQAETVLMHLIRGSGLRGLGGMLLRSPLPEAPDLELIRPLLHVWRAQIEAYLGENGLSPVEDVTNRDTALLRNHIRHVILPSLRQCNPQIGRALAQLADSAAVDSAYLDSLAAQTGAQAGSCLPGQRVVIRRAAFAALPLALRRRWVGWAAKQVRPSADVTYDALVKAADLGVHGVVGAQALLPGRLRLRVDYEELCLEALDAPLPVPDWPLLDHDELAVSIPGETPLPGGRWTLLAALTPQAASQAQLAIPPGAQVTLRPRRPGDRFAPLGMAGHTQKVNRWMINHKVPRELRRRLPLLCVEGQVAALIVGEMWAVADPFAVRHSHQRVVYFGFLQNP